MKPRFALALSGLLALQPLPALAHAMLVSASPRVGSTVSASPNEITLTLSEGIEAALSGIEITDATGQKVKTGRAAAAPGNPAMLVVKLPTPLAPGRYEVAWHVVSADTHKTQGHFAFQVGP